ncbi:hypothetical protein BDW59DRAFT_32573 [Aspergillus cavernicola]|uniref:Mitochondrial ATPase expression-domain-containing protein n=1 Tax=Aspergillus cavernicola TaxID=176166 RepID=A0ABR4IPJ1_9EURO
MSSVWNHAPNRSMVLSLRAAHLSSRSFRKGCPYSTSFRPIYPKSLDSPTSAFLCPSSSTQSEAGLHGIGLNDADPSSCEFWCSSRLIQSRLNQPTLPLTNVPEPWGAIVNCGRENHDAESDSTTRRETKPSQDKHGKHQRLRQNSSLNKKRGGSDRSSNHEPSPSDYLIDTIQNMVLSRDARDSNWTFSGSNSQNLLMTSLTLKQRVSFKKQSHSGSLQEIIADYIQYVDPVLQEWKSIDISSHSSAALELDDPLRSMLRDNYVACLISRGYDFTDVMAWAWVLKSNTTYEATLRIFLLGADQAVNESDFSRRIPAFIPLMLLRQDLDLKTFRLLLVYSLHIISGQAVPPLNYSFNDLSNDVVSNHIYSHHQVNAEPWINPSMCATFVVRLLSHARRLWPEAQLSIAQALAVYLRTSKSLGSSFVTEKLNMCLRLLSLPSGPRPFVSASVRQQAQFELLKAMVDKHPVSPVTRRGYQGLAAVQLAHKKTSAERESAELKAPSWPPWKEAKSGIDSQKGVEGMRSRTMRVISQMREAGYPSSLWEKVTGILAGWDTDNSPTTQTRTLMRPPATLRGRAQQLNHRAIWEARIRSTRTVREAWACFLAYENQGLSPHSAIYTAMGEKLIFGRKTTKRQLHQSSLALPGDGLEVFPEPASARDWIYTPTEPPTLSEFIKRMLSHGIRPSGRFLAFLIHHTPSFRVGLDCLNCSDLTNQQLRALFTVGEGISEHDFEHQKALDGLPDYLISAFIRFLCRFAIVASHSLNLGDIPATDAFPIITGNWAKTPHHIPTLYSYTDKRERPKKAWYSKLLSHAIRLLRKRNSQSPQGWVQLLAGLRSARILGDPSRVNRHAQMVLAWHEILEALKWSEERNIEMGSDGFQILCQSFSSAVTAGVKDPDAMEKGLELLATASQKNAIHSELAPSEFEDMIHNGLTTLKSQFDRLVLLDPKTSSVFETLRLSLEKTTESPVIVPALPHVPSPAILHAFVRSLGLAEDADGLLSLLRWMSKHALTLNQASDEYLNGDMMMRRTVVAVRLFLEGYWGRQRTEPIGYESDFTFHITPRDPDVPTFSDPILQEAHEIVTATEIWGPWPSDEEVWEYLAHGEQ